MVVEATTWNPYLILWTFSIFKQDILTSKTSKIQFNKNQFVCKNCAIKKNKYIWLNVELLFWKLVFIYDSYFSQKFNYFVEIIQPGKGEHLKWKKEWFQSHSSLFSRSPSYSIFFFFFFHSFSTSWPNFLFDLENVIFWYFNVHIRIFI